ncbi:MAG: PKD domain-containing protein, partial [Euryarchaeota archaeon]|nr:PKD domain-containing protein [Euryarchaeota archaeon]
MEVHVNSGLNIILIAAMLVLLMAVPAAAAQITVDGNGSDWDPSWFLVPDNASDIGITNGYDLTGVWQHYNATDDKLYFMYNVSGIAGDSNGDGNPNTPDNGWPGGDQYGVGSMEMYVLMINTSPTGDPLNFSDVMLTLIGNSATVSGPKAHLVSSVTAAIKTTGTFTPFVEFSVGNVSGWVANPYRYSLYGYAGSLLDYAPEDWLDTFIYVTFPPVANFTFVAGDCNQTVWFDPSRSYDDPYGGIVNYTWDFGDGTGADKGSDNSSFSHTFPVTNGTYNVNLTVIDTDGLTNSFVMVVPVNREPSISLVTPNKTSVVEPGEWVLFEGWYSDPDGDTLTHRWFVDGVEIASGSSTTYSNASYFVNRTLTANLTISDPNNCTATNNTTITYLHRPVPVINFTATGCLRVELNASNSSDPDGVITDYLWYAENGTIDNSTNVTCTANFSVGGNHTIRLNVTDNDGLTNTTTMEICVSRVPTADAQANRTNVTSPGGWVLFNATNSTCDTACDTSNSLNYTWNISDDSGCVVYSNVSVLYPVTSNTTATLNVTDKYGCTATNNTTVTYLHRPIPVINFTATGCLRVELNASNSSDPDGVITDYLWYAENGTIDNSTNVTCTANFSEGGYYTVRLNVTDNIGLTNTTTMEICVSCKPRAVAQANRTNVTSPGGWVLFNATNSTCDTACDTSNSLNYTWNISDDIGCVVYHKVSVLYPVTSNTTATLNVTDKYGCTATNNTTVTYLHRPIPVINFTATGCLEVELNASESYDPDGYITDYLWDAENGTIDNSTNVTCTANFSAGGNHTIRLNVTDNIGLTNTTTMEICVSCKPRAVAQANRTNVTSPGGWVLFNATNSTCDTACDT